MWLNGQLEMECTWTCVCASSQAVLVRCSTRNNFLIDCPVCSVCHVCLIPLLTCQSIRQSAKRLQLNWREGCAGGSEKGRMGMFSHETESNCAALAQRASREEASKAFIPNSSWILVRYACSLTCTYPWSDRFIEHNTTWHICVVVL